jgi:hypothetical protein
MSCSCWFVVIVVVAAATADDDDDGGCRIFSQILILRKTI